MEGGRENSGSKEEKKIIAAPHGRPTLLLPPQTAGFGFSGISPGPITLASSFFPEDPDSDCRSFSQLLAGATNSPLANQRRVTDEMTGESEVNCSGSAGRSSSVAAWSSGDGGSENKVKGGCEMNSSFFTVPPGLSPGSLMDSPAFFSSSSHSQEIFGISHQQVLAQVTSQAGWPHSHTNDLEQNPPVSASTTTVLHPFSSIVSTFQQMTKQESDNKSITLDLPDGLHHVDQRSQSSTVIVDKPADDGYNWRKYGQKQVKGSEYPRSYYKCTHTKCPVKKKVERSLDGQVTEIIYKGQHNHEKPPPGRRAREGVTLSNESNGISVMENGSDSQSGNFISSSETYRRDQESGQTAEQLSGSSDVDELADNEVGITVKDEDLPYPKRRNVDTGFSKPGTLQKTVTEPRIIVQTTSEVDLLDDGFRWRKYGQKVVKGNPHPRSYYKCTYTGCTVRKHVERASTDPRAVITTYEGKHNHDIPAARNSSHHIANTGIQPKVENATNLLQRTEFRGSEQNPAAVLELKKRDNS